MKYSSKKSEIKNKLTKSLSLPPESSKLSLKNSSMCSTAYCSAIVTFQADDCICKVGS